MDLTFLDLASALDPLDGAPPFRGGVTFVGPPTGPLTGSPTGPPKRAPNDARLTTDIGDYKKLLRDNVTSIYKKADKSLTEKIN